MPRRLVLFALVALLGASPRAQAQFLVLDAANLREVIAIAQQTYESYLELQHQRQTLERMALGLTSLGAYRLPTLPIPRHDPGRWTYGAGWIQALNSGDPAGLAYRAAAIPLPQMEAVLAQLPLAARRTLERQLATVEITDAAATLGGHQVAAVRGYGDRLQAAVQALEGDVVNDLARFHEMTAILDKIAAGELVARRQDMAANQLLAHALEQLLARNKRLRDTEAAALTRQFVTWRDSATANDAFVAGTADALRTWRQP